MERPIETSMTALATFPSLKCRRKKLQKILLALSKYLRSVCDWLARRFLIPFIIISSRFTTVQNLFYSFVRALYIPNASFDSTDIFCLDRVFEKIVEFYHRNFLAHLDTPPWAKWKYVIYVGSTCCENGAVYLIFVALVAIFTSVSSTQFANAPACF